MLKVMNLLANTGAAPWPSHTSNTVYEMSTGTVPPCQAGLRIRGSNNDH